MQATTPSKLHASMWAAGAQHNSLPITSSQINRLSSPHILHDVFDTPRLEFVSLGVVRLKRIFVLHVHTLLQALGALGVVFVCVSFRVVGPDPFGKFGCGAARVELDFVPVGVLEEFGVGEAELLGAGIADESKECELENL